MTGTNWLTAGALLVSVLCVVLATATAGQRAARERAERRRARLLAPVRPLVLRLAAGADDGTALDHLKSLDRRAWAAAEPLVVTVVGKIRGEARDDLVGLLEAHGAGERALGGLASRSMPRRANAAETLGVLRHQGYAEPLLGLLHDPSPDVRQVAARSLGMIGEPAAAPALIATLDGAVPAQTVAQALLRIGAAAAPTLTDALESGSDTVRAVAVEVLGLFQAVAAVHSIAAALAADPSLGVRERAATALGRLGHPAALPTLRAALEPDQPMTVRAAAAAALGSLGASDAVPDLARLLADPNHRVAHNAAMALTLLGSPGVAALAAAAAAAQDRPDGHAAPAGLIGLGGLAGEHAAAALATLPAGARR